MELTAPEIRVLGALIEKHQTTPGNYPLSMQALIAACNQQTNRDPVVDYDEDTVDGAVQGLRHKELVRSIRGKGHRVLKHRHVADETLELTSEQTALLGVLLLRGPQTPGELRSRSDRYVTFPDLESVEVTLEELAQRDEPLVRRLPRAPGQKEHRYRHLLGTDGKAPSSPDPRPEGIVSAPEHPAGEVWDAIDELKKRLDRLVEALGFDEGDDTGLTLEPDA